MDDNFTELELLPVCNFCGYVFRKGIEIKYHYREINGYKVLDFVGYKPNICPRCNRGINNVFINNDKVREVSEDIT